MDYADDRAEIVRLVAQVEKLESKVSGADKNDPDLLAVDYNPVLRKMVARLRHLDDTRLQRVYDKIDGYLDALEEVDGGKHENAG